MNKNNKAYLMLFWMGRLHLPVMYFIMFAMVDTWADVFMNLNTFNLALKIVSPMLVMMLLAMLRMYPDNKMPCRRESLSFTLYKCGANY